MNSARFVCPFAIFVASSFLLLAGVRHLPVAQGSSLRERSSFETLPAPLAAHRPPQKITIKFAKAVAYSSDGYGAVSVAVADLNGDGISDLVVANVCAALGSCPGGAVSVLLGKGDGTFEAPVSYSTGGDYAESVTIADVNGDGHPDLVVANLCQGNCGASAFGEVAVLLGNGDGTFRPAVTYGVSGYHSEGVAVADLNGDGHPDLVVANLCQSNSCANGSVSVLLNQGNGTFRPPVVYSVPGYYSGAVVIGDVNGDGRPDLAVSSFCQTYECQDSDGQVAVLLGNGDGTFQAAVSYDSGGSFGYSLAMGDVNGDGHPDLAVMTCPDLACGTGEVSVLLGNGDGTFQAAVPYASGGAGGGSVAIADVNGDGKPDLIAGNNCLSGAHCSSTAKSGVAVLMGNGDGTFQAPDSYASGGCCGAYSVAAADLNGDHRPDLIAASYCQTGNCGNGVVGVLMNETLLATKTKVTSSPNPSEVNQPVTFTATISSSSPVPDGETVTFYNAGTEMGTSTTTGGVATLTTSFPETGTFTIKARYPGDAFHKASSGTVKQVVNQ